MSVSIRAEPAAHARPGAGCQCNSALAVYLAVAASLLLSAGCSAPPSPPFAGPHPADPDVRTPQAGYRSTIAPYEGRRPVEPGSWREQNERVAPRPRS